MTTPQLTPLPEQSMTHHITDEQIGQIAEQVGLVGPASRVGDCHAASLRFARAVLALAAPQGEPVAWMWQHEETGRKGFVEAEQLAMGWEANNPRLRITAPLYTAPAQAVPSDERAAFEAWARPHGYDLRRNAVLGHYSSLDTLRAWKGWQARAALTAAPTPTEQPAVPEDVVREPMAQKWFWWLDDDEKIHMADTESEAHGEARLRIDAAFEPGETHEYSVARVQHPIDALGMDWLAEHVAQTIEENACCWCDDNTCAEEPAIVLDGGDRKALGMMVAAFLREKARVRWWTPDQKTITTHTYVAGSNDDAARAAEKGGE